MYQLSSWQYFKLNKKTTISCFKICSVVLTGIATTIAVGVKLKTGKEEDSLMVFIASELFGYGTALLIFMIALIEGFIKAKLTIERYNSIPFRVKHSLSLELLKNH